LNTPSTVATRENQTWVLRKAESSVRRLGAGTGGAVSVETVTAQLLYEIAGPRYPSPDVVARFDTIELERDGTDRVRISGVRGEPAPDHLKVEINYLDKNKEHMRYKSFREQGLFVGSGVIEAACKTIVAQRNKQSGMDWTESTAINRGACWLR
jgi:hypothetical protein